MIGKILGALGKVGSKVGKFAGKAYGIKPETATKALDYLTGQPKSLTQYGVQAAAQQVPFLVMQKRSEKQAARQEAIAHSEARQAELKQIGATTSPSMMDAINNSRIKL